MKSMGVLPASLALSGWAPMIRMKSTWMHMVCADVNSLCVRACVHAAGQG